MRTYIARRLLILVPIWVGVSIFIFILMRIIPGDVAAVMLGEDEIVSKAELEDLRHRLGLDRPIHQQYGTWLWGAVHLDFGDSFISQRPVIREIFRSVGPSAQLAVMSLFVGVIIALPLGILSAYYQDTWVDYLGRVFSISGLAVPNFWLGTLLILFFLLEFRWSVPIVYVSPFKDPVANLQKMVWPALISGSSGAALISRMIRSSMLEVLREDYVRTARAKGLLERQVLVRHALRNAMLPVVTVVGIYFAILLSGQIIMESLFIIPGLGDLLISSIRDRDYPVVEATLLVVATIVLISNLVVDITYAWLNPTIRYAGDGR